MSGGEVHPGESERDRLLESAVTRLSSARRTFTEHEALSEVWKAGYEVTPESDARFALASEADAVHPRQWRLATQVLANNRPLDALNARVWDGRDVDGMLARLDAEDSVHYVFCPTDARFAIRSDGTLEPADREQDVVMPPDVRAALDALGPALLDPWHAAGAHPWTVQQVVDMLGTLGWTGTSDTKGSLWARAWLREGSSAGWVGRDYWVPADVIPQVPEQQRIAVLPLQGAPMPPPLGGGGRS